MENTELEEIYRSCIVHYESALAGMFKILKIEVRNIETDTWTSTLTRGVDNDFSLEEENVRQAENIKRWQAIGHKMTVSLMEEPEITTWLQDCNRRLEKLEIKHDTR